MNRLLIGTLGVVIMTTFAWIFWPGEKAAPVSSHIAKVNPYTPEGIAQAEMARKLKRRAKGYAKPDGPDEFVRYHDLIRTRQDDPSVAYRLSYRLDALRAARVASKASGQLLDWKERGPANVAGRTRALVVDPEDEGRNTWYAGAVGGGIWKTSDAGQSWQNLTPDLPNLSVSSLAQGVSNPDVLYAGTGEGYGNADAIDGDGIWKTTDRGATWMQLAFTASSEQFRAVNRLVVDPNDADVVVAATNEGLFRTADGGATWTQVLARPQGNVDGRLQQVAAHPDDFNILYATANGLGVFQSMDAGLTWTLVFNIQQAGTRIELAIAPSDRDRVYVSVYNGVRSDMYLTDDGGSTWDLLPERFTEEPNFLGRQGWYDNAIGVHPFDRRAVFVGGVNLWTVDAGFDLTGGWRRTTTQLTNWFEGLERPEGGVYPYTHADHHILLPIALDENQGTVRLLNTNDGGVEYSDDGGITWNQTLNGYNTSQFYGADKRPGRDEYIGGMQDNGTWRSPDAVSSTASTDWFEQLGGDGFEVAWHAEDPAQIIGTVQFNQIARTLDGGATWRFATEGLTDTGNRGHFITTIAKSQSDPELIFTTGRSGVWRSDNFGETWTLSSFADSPGSWDFNGLRAPAAISIADPQVVWAGPEMSGRAKVFVSTDGGLTFNPTSRPSSIDAVVTGLATHPTDSETAYVAFSVPGDPKLLRTTDLGATWENLTGTFRSGPLSSNGFPDVATFSLVVMPHNPEELWAGTEIGLFISTDGGANWSYADNGLPAAAIWQMRIVDDQVVVATHGRGVWSVTLPELANYAPPVVTRAPRLNALAFAPSGGVNLSLSLRSAYDSVVVQIDGERAFSFTTNALEKDTLVALPLMVTETRDVMASVVAYREGRAFVSSAATTTLFPVVEAQVSYVNDLNEAAANDDFIGDDFSVRSVNGFLSRALHSQHSYADDKSHIAQLRVPILVDNEDAMLTYRDVAIVEPGEPGTQFGDAEFWDYVIVEATTDGITWQPLLDGYDARADVDWHATYNNNDDGTEALMVEHTINLLDTFAPGEVIFLRFRLFADANSHGWGWAIDDIVIQEREDDTGIANEDEADVPGRFALAQNYPNPFNPATTIPFSVPRSGPVTIRVYDVQGRLIATVADGLYPAGSHQVQWKAGSLASGIYYYRLETPGMSLSRSLTLLK